MMKLWAPLLCISLLLNVYVLWRFQDATGSIPKTTNLTKNATNQRIVLDGSEINQETMGRHLVDNISNLGSMIDDLSKRVSSLEAESAATEVKAEKNLDFRESAHSAMATVRERLSVKPVDEEWFWNDSDGEELSMSLVATESFNIQSVNCRSGWCRVEIEEYSTNGEDVDSSGELHLKINESLGRDTTIRWGKQQGNRRVLFIK